MIRLNRRVASLKASSTMAAEMRARELRAAGQDVISLAAGEPDFDTPQRIKHAALQALERGQTKYTPSSGTVELKEAIRLKLSRSAGLDYPVAQIMASAGGKQAACNVIATLFDEGDEVILPTPIWVSFAAMVQLSGAEPKALPTEQSDGFLLDPQALGRAITARTRGIVINSPCNPTGAVYPAKRLAALARVFLEAELWVVCDDAYADIVYDLPEPHLFAVEPRLGQRGVVVNTFSKSYAMTGWRLGFAAGPREVIAAAARLQGQNSGNPCSITQAAGIEALTGPQDDVAAMVAEFRRRRDLVVRRVRELPGFRLPEVPAGAFYVFPEVSQLLGRTFRGTKISDGDALAGLILEEARVAVVGGNDFGAANHIRLSYAAPLSELEEAFDRIGRLTAQILG